MTGEMPICSAIVCMSSVCQGKGPVPINSSIQNFRTIRGHSGANPSDNQQLGFLFFGTLVYAFTPVGNLWR